MEMINFAELTPQDQFALGETLLILLARLTALAYVHNPAGTLSPIERGRLADYYATCLLDLSVGVKQ